LNDYHVAGLPTNIGFLKRAINMQDFKDNDFDTSIIEENQEELLKPSREISLTRMGSIAIVKVFLETLKMRFKRDHDLDPWFQRDMFRLNHDPFRRVQLVNIDTDETIQMRIQYLNENKFNSYVIDKDGYLTSCNQNVEVEMSQDKKDELILRTDQEIFKVDFFIGEDDEVIQIDYDDNPIPIRAKPNKLVTEEDVMTLQIGGAAVQTSVVSPMPGRIVKCFVQPGETVKKGQTLVSVESMKMEYFVKATGEGVVDKISCKEGDAVQLKQKLISLKPVEQ